MSICQDTRIEQRRLRAWKALGKSKQWSSIWLGEDYLAIDELACKLYRAIVSKDMEKIAVARHAFEEIYDLGPGQMPTDPYERPPEITAQLKAQGLIA